MSYIQAALFAGAATHAVFPYTPRYHFTGGIFNEYGIPTRLQFTQEPGWLDFLTAASSYEPIPYMLDNMNIVCGMVDVPFDDHLAEITNPIFFVGSGGGEEGRFRNL